MEGKNVYSFSYIDRWCIWDVEMDVIYGMWKKARMNINDDFELSRALSSEPKHKEDRY